MSNTMDRESKQDAVTQWLLVAAHKGWMGKPDPEEYETPDEFADAFLEAVAEAEAALPAHDVAAIERMAGQIVDFLLDPDVPTEAQQ